MIRTGNTYHQLYEIHPHAYTSTTPSMYLWKLPIYSSSPRPIEPSPSSSIYVQAHAIKMRPCTLLFRQARAISTHTAYRPPSKRIFRVVAPIEPSLFRRWFSANDEGRKSIKDDANGGFKDGVINLGPPDGAQDTDRSKSAKNVAESTVTSKDTESTSRDTISETSKPEHQDRENEKQNSGKLPSQLEQRRWATSKQLEGAVDQLQAKVFTAGQRLNDLTGYSSIEKLKEEIAAQEETVRNSRSQVRAAKDAYSAAIHRRSTSQREVNELLQRKHAWSPTDLERFTSLYRSDHANEVGESEAQKNLFNAERRAEEAYDVLSRSILTRYHEEQIWSDKIRRMSTWGTWGLMGVNVLLFLVLQVAVEPWRRKRLVKGFEEKVAEALDKGNQVGVVGKKPAAVEAGSEAEAADAVMKKTLATKETRTDSETTIPELEKGHDSASRETNEEKILQRLSSDYTDNASIRFSPGFTAYVEFIHEKITQILGRISSIIPSSLPLLSTVRGLLRDDADVTLKQRDLTVLKFESAVIGAAVTATLAALAVRLF